MMHMQEGWASMCSGAGPMNIEMDEIRWYKYRCEDCGKVYKSTGKRFSVCPDCKSENVVMV
jgi:rRNA maturation endonuclease Nob1